MENSNIFDKPKMFRINDELKNKILAKVPENADALLGSVIIYSELCKTLEYSFDFFLRGRNFNEVEAYYIKPKNLKDIDGETRKDVTCYTFAAIMAEIVSQRYPEVEFYPFDYDHAGHFDSLHFFNTLTIDGVEYDFDPLKGIMENNDLMGLKFAGNNINGISIGEIKNAKLALNKDEVYNNFYSVLEYVNELNNNDFDRIVAVYKTQKSKEWVELSLEERFSLFLQMLEKCPKNTMASLGYIVGLKKSLFKKQEHKLYPKENDEQFIQVSFVKDEKENDVKALIFFNKSGVKYKADNRIEQSLADLQVYEFSINEKKLEKTSIEQLNQKAKQARYSKRYGEIPNFSQSWDIECSSIRGLV